VLGDHPLGPWDIDTARPFEDAPKLFAAPLVQQRDGTWAFVGFLNCGCRRSCGTSAGRA
jgi:beta-fructofuranosidase